MNLIEVLENNGTGLLEGVCRLGERCSHFAELFSSLRPELDFSKNSIVVDEKVKVTFSLNEINLGTFEVDICKLQYKKSRLEAEILNPNDEDEIICYLNIFWPNDPFFPRFQAILKNKPYELLTTVKS